MTNIILEFAQSHTSAYLDSEPLNELMETDTAAAAEEKDWREECVQPKKDTRVQTLVGILFSEV